MTTIKRWAASAAVLTFLLIVLGGWVRITGSGLGCGDEWPLCNGRLIPPLDEPATLIEWGHRLVASLVAALVAGTAVVAWLRRGARGVGGPSGPLAAAMVSLGLLVLQVLLG
ncbi:MAG: COX15/CtaA family protein, partial [Gemmatimonadales bacterium]